MRDSVHDQHIFESNEYREKLDDIASNLIQYSQEKDNEATIGAYFEEKLYKFIESKFNRSIEFDKEQTKKDLHVDVFKGRIDAVANNLIIEYKRPSTFTNASDSVREDGINQLKDYLTQLKDDGNVFDGIITDGTCYIRMYYSDGDLVTTPLRRLDVDGLDFIIKSILNVDKKQFVGANLINDFGNYSPLVKLQRALYDQLQDTDDERTKMLFEEWMSMYHLSLNDNGKSNTIKERRLSLSKAIDRVLNTNNEEYHALFALETGYAIVVKIFALKILSKINLNNNVEYFEELTDRSLNQLRDDFESFENGYVFKTNQVNNLLEQDFFSWYSSKNIWNSAIAQPIMDLVRSVESYTDTSIIYKFESTDLFREIYMLTIPSDVRKAFGEFFTPSWLADNVIEESIQMVGEDKDWTFLDPTCGSGTFLLRAINKIIVHDKGEKKSNDEILKDILTRVRGIDLNPLSVLSAKVSYLLAIRPFITQNTPNFEIPVYLGDSAKLPRILDIGDVKYVEYSINTQNKKIGKIDAILPYSFVSSSNFLSKINSWQTLIKSEQVNILSKSIESVFPKQKNEEINKKIKEKIDELSTTLIRLYQENWDGIWLRIISNFMLPIRIKNMDIIAGNPPWVKWENLPQEYAKEIKHIAGDINLFSGKSYGLGGGINLNLAALISNVVGDHWLNNTGVLAFLMPDTLLNSDSYEGWRKFKIQNNKSMNLLKVTDWSNAGHPFTPVTDKFLTYFVSKKKISGDPVLESYNKKFPRKINITKINEHNSWDEVKQYFSKKEGKLVQLSSSSTRYSRFYNITDKQEEKFKLLYGINDYKPRQGAELTPREVYIFTKDRYGKYSHIISKGAKIKARPFNHQELEDGIMRPLLQSKNIAPFKINTENIEYGLIPYDDQIKIYSEVTLSEKFPKAYEYLLLQKDRITQQSSRSKAMARGEEFYALSKLGKYSVFKYGVAFRDNSDMKAAFIDNTKGIKYFPVKHAPYISMDKKGNKLSKDEAIYLTGILNLSIINQYFKATYSERSYSINFDIRIPKFKDDNSIQKEMVRITKKLLVNPSNEELLNNLEDEYIKLLKDEKKGTNHFE